MLKNYLKIAFRNLFRNKTYAFINIFGLGFSIGAVILIMLYIRFEFSFDDFHKEKDQLYRISINAYREGNLEGETYVFTPPIGPAMKQDFPEVKNYTRYSTNVTSYFYIDGEPIRVENISYADSTFFDVFSFELLSGNSATVLTAPNSIVLTNKTADKIFGNEDPIGKTILTEDKEQFVVTGIVKSPPANSTIQFDALLSFSTLYTNPHNYMDWRGGNKYITYIKLAPNTNPNNLEAKFPDFMWKYINKDLAEYNVKYEPYLQSMEDIHLVYNSDGMTNIYIFSAVGLLILLIASINFINLTTANYTKRAKEVGIRKVVGANKKLLVIQFISESLLITFIALIVGIIIAVTLSPFYRELMQKDFFAINLLDPIQLTALVGILFVVGILAGSYPAFYLSSLQAAITIKKGVQPKIGKLSLQNFLIVMQFTISISLIILTIVISDQLAFIKNKNLGFNKENILYLTLENDDAGTQTELIKQRLLTIPGVLHASASSEIPSNGFAANGYLPQGIETPVIINVLDVDADFFDTYDIKLIEGRNFSKEFTTDANAYIINKAFAKEFNWENPIGKKISRNGSHNVIGVVDDFNFASLHDDIAPLIITSTPYRNQFQYISLKVKTSDYQKLINDIQITWASINSTWPFEYSFLDETFDKVYKAENNFMKLFFYFSTLAIIIAALGLFSLSSLAAEQKTKEIGVRKVLGATVYGITTLITKKYLYMILIANIIAWPIAYLTADSWLADYAFRIDITIAPFILATIFAALIAVLSVSYRAIKAATVNPVNSLSSE